MRIFGYLNANLLTPWSLAKVFYNYYFQTYFYDDNKIIATEKELR